MVWLAVILTHGEPSAVQRTTLPARCRDGALVASEDSRVKPRGTIRWHGGRRRTEDYSVDGYVKRHYGDPVRCDYVPSMQTSPVLQRGPRHRQDSRLLPSRDAASLPILARPRAGSRSRPSSTLVCQLRITDHMPLLPRPARVHRLRSDRTRTKRITLRSLRELPVETTQAAGGGNGGHCFHILRCVLSGSETPPSGADERHQ